MIFGDEEVGLVQGPGCRACGGRGMVHSDFMFGSADMEITGLTQDGQIVKLFEKGNFVI